MTEFKCRMFEITVKGDGGEATIKLKTDEDGDQGWVLTCGEYEVWHDELEEAVTDARALSAKDDKIV